MTAANPGDTIALKRGDTFNERCNVTKDWITVRPYGTGANPKIDGGSQARHCFVCSAKQARIEDIDTQNGITGVTIQGQYASGSVFRGTHNANGSGIAVGGGGTEGQGENGHGFGPAIWGQLILADGCTITGSTGITSQGDGIQIGEDATDDLHTIRNCTITGSHEVGLNFKSGYCEVYGCTLSDNQWTGYTVQNNARTFRISNSTISNNHQAGNGVGQVSIEDHAKVFSINNIYSDPHNVGGNATAHVLISGQNEPNSFYTQNMAFYSLGDTFINRTGQTNSLGSIAVRALDKPCTIGIAHATFDHELASIGRAIDALNSTALVIEFCVNNIFFMGTSREAFRVPQTATFGAAMDYNQYSGSAAAMFRLMNGSTTVNSYSAAQLANFFSATGAEQHGQSGSPLFADAANGDYALGEGSPALASGVDVRRLVADRLGVSFGHPPNRGARA
jgi:hypothetical protein